MSGAVLGLPIDRRARTGVRTNDLALGITPTSNVGYNNIGFITDGDDTTHGDATSTVTPQYVQVDLGRIAYVNWSRILWYDAPHSPLVGTIDRSLDGTNWVNVALIQQGVPDPNAITGLNSSSIAMLDQSFLIRSVGRYWRIYTTTTMSPIGGSFTGINIYTWSLYS